MSEEELNINYIREKTGLVENDELIPIILEMIKDSYKAGLNQSEYDNTMGLIEENQELKAKIRTYEDPDDLTLMFMYCDEKAKDKIKTLKKQIEELKDKIERIREIVENSDWRLDDVHDLIDGYDEIAKIII